MKGAAILLLVLAVVIGIFTAGDLTSNYNDRAFETKLMRDHPSLIGTSTLDSSLKSIEEIDGRIQRDWILVIVGVCILSVSLVLFSKAKKEKAAPIEQPKTV
jgi:hypothetical protein